jgi:hypothetical protein
LFSFDVFDSAMAEFYRQFAFVSSVLAGFAFTFYGTLLVAAREHRAGTWAAFFAVAASVAFLPVTLGMTFGAVHAVNQAEPSVSNAAADPQIVLLSILFLSRKQRGVRLGVHRPGVFREPTRHRFPANL